MSLPDPIAQIALTDFDLIERIDGGAWGEVWRAVQREAGRSVAVKFLAPARGSAGVDRARADELAWRFKREIEAAAAQNHPHIARVYASGVAGGRPWFAMELVEGEPLDVFAADLPLPARLELFLKVCEGVQHAHDRGVIHRDLKPANILVGADGLPKILDFGLARFLDDTDLGQTLSLDGQTLGTPMFMAPEQASGKMGEISVKADVYALGIILYRLLTRAWPYNEKLPPLQLLSAARDSEPLAPRRASPTLPRDLEAIILKALAKQKTERYPGVRDLTKDVLRFLAHEPVRARAWTFGYVWRRRARRHWRGLATAGLVLALCGGFFASSLEQRRNAAERNTRALDVAREVVNVMLFKLHGKLTAIGQPEIYADIAAQAAKLPWPVDADGSGKVDLLQAQALASRSRGDIFLGAGDAPRACEAYREAIASLKKLAGAHPGEARFALDLAVGQLALSSALGQSHHPREAADGLRGILTSLEVLHAPECEDQLEKMRAGVHRELGEILSSGEDAGAAEKEFLRALALYSSPPAADPGKYALVQESLGDLRCRHARPLEAIGTFAAAETFHRSVLSGAPLNQESRLGLGRCLARKAGAHLDVQQLAAAQLCLDEARDLCPPVTEKVSLAEVLQRRRVAQGFAALSLAQAAAGEEAAALNAGLEAAAQWKIIFRRGALQISDRAAVVEMRCHLATLQERHGQLAEAANSLRVALEQGKRLTRERVDDARWFPVVADLEMRLLALPRNPATPSRKDQLTRIAADLARFDALPKSATQPHRAKVDDLRVRLAAEIARPLAENEAPPASPVPEKGAGGGDDAEGDETPPEK